MIIGFILAGSKPLTFADYGVVTLMFFIAIGLLRLLTFVVKSRFENESKTISRSSENITHLQEKLDGVAKKTDEIHATITKFNKIFADHAEFSSGASDRIDKNAMSAYRRICLIIGKAINADLEETKETKSPENKG
jgi:hypothetical protein